MNFRKLTRRAFTLVEVLLALFVFTFGLLGLLGVMAGLLKSVSVIDEKHQTADLASLLQQALRYNPDTNQARSFDEVYKEIINKPVAYLTYTVQTDPTKNETRETKIVPASKGISQTDFENLNGPIVKIIAQVATSYRSVSVPTNTGTVTKITTWAKDPTTSPDPYVSIDAFVYVLERPETTAALDVTERHPDVIKPARRFTITLPR